MTKEDKLDKVTKDFSLLPEEKQDYILGVIQALAFAHETADEQAETVTYDSGQSAEPV
jgi:hypothetical protein